jgi:hypothetical protein
MDQSLFKKYSLQVQKNKNEKDELIIFIQEKFGIALEHQDVTLSKKDVTLIISSAQKAFFNARKIKDVLKEKGYTLK